MKKRVLGRSGIEVSPMGLGCWAIGGEAYRDGKPIGWGKVDDNESIEAIHRAVELGVTFFDTADVYGCGHSEDVLGRALEGRRDRVVIATKFGQRFEEGGEALDQSAEPGYIRKACEDSLRRLRTDVIDLYQFHIWKYPIDKARPVLDTCEQLVDEGKIRAYGWSTDTTEAAELFATGPHCTAIQQDLNLFEGNEEILRLCHRENLASIARSPLGRGLLTGKFDKDSELPESDVRHKWDFSKGRLAARLERLEELKAVLTEDGRSLAQAALAWIWSRSDATIPIPGFRNVRQVEENAAAMQQSLLTPERMQRIDEIVGDLRRHLG